MNAILRHRSEEEAGGPPSTMRSDDQQGRTTTRLDEHTSSQPISDLAFAHEHVIDLMDPSQGLVHDGCCRRLMV